MNPIILEGPDGAGKSTLAKEFARFGYVVAPFGVPPKEVQKSEESIFHFFFDPVVGTKYQDTNIVFDRLHLSDRIYAPLMRGGTPMTLRAEILIERYLEAVDGQIVICLPPFRVAFNNWVQRKGQEYVQEAKTFRAVYEAYARLLFNQKRNNNFLWYDYTRRSASGFARAVADWRGFPLPNGVVGSQRPRFLFVGERPGESDSDTHNAAFMTPTGSSGWLFDRIREAGYRESEIAFVNTFLRNGDSVNLEHIVLELEGRGLNCVIGLGSVANAALLDQGIKFVPMPHPQFAKRFRSGDTVKYVNSLKEIRRKTK